ncbi:hypothetical protein R3P38DRAFT_2786809 [Favolaschia claudopus]|uniref:Uncharacterized protein n=1 Tax=Favolaschia claudopus TaxID=2862362 RepID=A0AAW0APL3_9AGAR
MYTRFMVRNASATSNRENFISFFPSRLSFSPPSQPRSFRSSRFSRCGAVALSCSSPSYRSDIDGMLYVVASTTSLSKLLAVSSYRIVRVSSPGSLGSAGGFGGSGSIL